MIRILPALTKKFCLNAKPSFYRDINSSKADRDNSRINDLFFGDASPKSLNLEEKEKCEGMLTKAECLQALTARKHWASR